MERTVTCQRLHGELLVDQLDHKKIHNLHDLCHICNFFKVVAQKMCYLNIFYRSVNIIRYVNIMSFRGHKPCTTYLFECLQCKNCDEYWFYAPVQWWTVQDMPVYHPMTKVHSTKSKGCLNHNLEKNKLLTRKKRINDWSCHRFPYGWSFSLEFWCDWFTKPNLSDWWLAGCSHCLAQAWKTLNQRLSQIVSGSKISKFIDLTFFQSGPISNQLC